MALVLAADQVGADVLTNESVEQPDFMKTLFRIPFSPVRFFRILPAGSNCRCLSGVLNVDNSGKSNPFSLSSVPIALKSSRVPLTMGSSSPYSWASPKASAVTITWRLENPHRQHPIVALDHPVGALHLGALIVRHIILETQPGLSGFVFIVQKPVLDLFDLTLQLLQILLLPGNRLLRCLLLVRLPVFGEKPSNGLFKLCLK